MHMPICACLHVHAYMRMPACACLHAHAYMRMPELLVRWVQTGIFCPRFTIHSWNTDLEGTPNGTCNEPWMYAPSTGLVRNALCFRYALIPYLYELLRRAHMYYEPILRPTFLDHEEDSACFAPSDDHMLGPHLLVCAVVDKGASARDVYLPRSADAAGWWDWHSGEWLAGGQTVRVPTPLHMVPLFAKAGTMVPLAEASARAALDGGGRRWLRLFPRRAATGGARTLPVAL